MGVVEKTTYAVSCDRCGKGGEQNISPQDDSNNWHYWARRGREGVWAHTQRMICSDCALELEFWFEGVLNTASRLYNSGSKERFALACAEAAKPRGG